MVKKKPSIRGKPWTNIDIIKLKKLANSNTPTWLIAYKLNRTKDAVRTKASEKKISLM